MSHSSPVVWYDGLFIKPHHFQQQQRWVEQFVHQRALLGQPYAWGFSRLELNKEVLVHGKITLETAEGMMPDGSLFRMPGDTPIPDIQDLTEHNPVNELVYLALPLRVNGVAEAPQEPTQTTRMLRKTQEARDIASIEAERHMVEVAQYRFRILMGSEDRDDFTCLPIARIREKRADGSLVLDRDFIPPTTSISAASDLASELHNFRGLIEQRAKNMASTLGAPGQASVGQVSDFMMLQCLNRLQAKFRFLDTSLNAHPHTIFGALLEALGELSTFTTADRLAPSVQAYNHDEPSLCFLPLINQLKQALMVVSEPNAYALTLKKFRHGIMTAEVPNPQTFIESTFVLAVKADMRLERLARDFPAQTKVSSIENIRDLVSLHLTGVGLSALPVAPRQIPYHAGYTYFQLDKAGQGWDAMERASGFAMHIAGEFSGLDIQFWAIRS